LTFRQRPSLPVPLDTYTAPPRMYLRRVQCRLMLLTKLLNRVLMFSQLCNWWSNLRRDTASLGKWFLTLGRKLSPFYSRRQGPWTFGLETVPMKAIRSFETSGGLNQATQRYIQNNWILGSLILPCKLWWNLGLQNISHLQYGCVCLCSSVVYTPPFHLMTFAFHMNLRISSDIYAACIWLVFKGSFARTA
jgi:hypothetical protein